MYEDQEGARDGMQEELQEELSRAAQFFMTRSGPTFGVEEVANGFIVRVRKLRKVPVPLPPDPCADPMLPSRQPRIYDHATYEEKYVCTKLSEVVNLLNEHFKPEGAGVNDPDSL